MEKILSLINFFIYTLNTNPEILFNIGIFIIFFGFLYEIFIKPSSSKYRKRHKKHKKKPKTKIIINRDENKLIHEDHTNDYYQSIWDEINKH